LKILVLSPVSSYTVRKAISKSLKKGQTPPQFIIADNSESEIDFMEDVEVVVGDHTLKRKIDSNFLDRVRNLKFIQQPVLSCENIDLQACAQRGIRVANVNEGTEASLAEYCIAVAISLLRNIFYSHMSLLEGNLSRKEVIEASSELKGKTWGILGINKDSIYLSRLVNSFGAKVLYHSNNKLEETEERRLRMKFKEFEQLLIESDVVSLHEDKSGIITDRLAIGENELKLMKPNSVLIATSKNVDEIALAKALLSSQIMGAAVDVFTSQEEFASNPLFLAAKEGAPVILTPHIAFDSADSKLRRFSLAFANVIRFISGEKPQNLVV
jgi:Lactate dehydrogenase and related dehydrogenases